MQATLKSSLFIIPFLLIGCAKREIVVNYFQDRNSGDTAEVRIIGFTAHSKLWDGYDCDQPYKMPPRGWYPSVRQTFDNNPAYIDKGFKKSQYPKNKYPLDMVEYHVRAGNLMTFWAGNRLSDRRLCQKSITIRPERDKLYEFRNSNDEDMCYFEVYEINKSTGAATVMQQTDYRDLCPIK